MLFFCGRIIFNREKKEPRREPHHPSIACLNADIMANSYLHDVIVAIKLQSIEVHFMRTNFKCVRQRERIEKCKKIYKSIQPFIRWFFFSFSIFQIFFLLSFDERSP